MDVLSHFFLPYVGALFALGLHRSGRPDGLDTARRAQLQAYALVFGLAGFAPDLDGLLDWTKHLPGLWWMQHRGVSHTLVGAPIFAFAVVGALHGLARWKPQRFGRFAFRPLYLVVALFGSWTHLMLDGVTYTGVPLLWPFADGRVTLGLFPWIVPSLFPIVLVFVVLHGWKRKLRTQDVAVLGVVVLVGLVAMAGASLHYRPHLDDGLVYARSDPTEWTVVRPVDGGYEAFLVDEGRHLPHTRLFFPHHIEPGAEEAVQRARATDAYRGFTMGLFGPQTVQTEPVDANTWRVTFTDVAARFEALNDPRWTPTEPHKDWGYVRLHVAPDTIKAEHLGW